MEAVLASTELYVWGNNKENITDYRLKSSIILNRYFVLMTSPLVLFQSCRDVAADFVELSPGLRQMINLFLELATARTYEKLICYLPQMVLSQRYQTVRLFRRSSGRVVMVASRYRELSCFRTRGVVIIQFIILYKMTSIFSFVRSWIKEPALTPTCQWHKYKPPGRMNC